MQAVGDRPPQPINHPDALPDPVAGDSELLETGRACGKIILAGF